MRLIDTRRLTGPNHLARGPLVIVDVALEPGDTVERALDTYRAELSRMREALELPPAPGMLARAHLGGAVFAYEAWIDMMLGCAEMSEWAALSACEILAAREPLALEPRRTEVAAMLARDRSPRLVAISHEAKERGLPLLWDDDVVTIGAGHRSASFPQDALPEITRIPWETLGTIPIALVTGTNGKTTSSRLLARLATEAGLRVGTTSTGGITVGAEVLEDGDWTGPAAARIVLRRSDVELAVLETARGGILRRGLAVDVCDVALITNVSDDHIGIDGIDDVAAMMRVKGVIAHAVRKTGTAVLNAHDANLAILAAELTCHVTFFADLDGARDSAAALEATRAVIAAHRAGGGCVVFAEGGAIHSAQGASSSELVRVDAVPITFGGAARYNVENVLGAVAAAEALGVAREAIVRGLRAFSNRDNPGRGQVVERAGVTIFLDFGHNPEGVRAVMQLVSSMRKGRLTVVTGSPGDRSDQEIADVARILYEARPSRVFVRELGEYLRGRAPGEVPALYKRSLLALGLPEEAFAIVTSEVEALERGLADSVPGDFIAVLVHLDQAEVHAFLGLSQRPPPPP